MPSRALTDRERKVLGMLVRSYIATASPVPSRTLAQALRGRWSAATIRNVLAALEAEGYLWQPHTSAGRIPTDAAYRLYVDEFVRKGPLSEEESGRIGLDLSGLAEDLDAMLERASELLAAFTRQAAVGTASARPLGLRFIRLFPADTRHAVLLVAAASGGMTSEVVDLPDGVTDEDLERVATRVNTMAAGRRYEDVAAIRVDEADPRPDARLLRAVVGRVQDALEAMRETRVALHGAQYLFEQPEFQSVESIQPLMQTFEEREALAELLGRDLGRGVMILIGGEIDNASMSECSVVAANFMAGSCAMGAVGIIGPKRMQYARMMSLVDAVAGAMSRALSRGEEGRR